MPPHGSRPDHTQATTFWLVRHAEVERRYHSIFGGRIDMQISRRGRRQARALARYLRGRHLDALYASPMRRVQQTLTALVRDPRFPQPVTRLELREVDFGEWTGLSWEGVMSRFGVSAFSWLEQLEQGAIPKAESAATLRGRLEPCVRDILASHTGQEVALLCHGGVIRMLLSILLGWQFSSLGGVEIEYASVTQVSISPPRVRLRLLNFTPWRDLGFHDSK